MEERKFKVSQVDFTVCGAAVGCECASVNNNEQFFFFFRYPGIDVKTKLLRCKMGSCFFINLCYTGMMNKYM